MNLVESIMRKNKSFVVSFRATLGEMEQLDDGKALIFTIHKEKYSIQKVKE